MESAIAEYVLNTDEVDQFLEQEGHGLFRHKHFVGWRIGLGSSCHWLGHGGEGSCGPQIRPDRLPKLDHTVNVLDGIFLRICARSNDAAQGSNLDDLKALRATK